MRQIGSAITAPPLITQRASRLQNSAQLSVLPCPCPVTIFRNATRFVVYETIIDDDRSKNVFGLLMSLNMLIETNGGFDYTGADCMGAAEFGDTISLTDQPPGCARVLAQPDSAV